MPIKNTIDSLLENCLCGRHLNCRYCIEADLLIKQEKEKVEQAPEEKPAYQQMKGQLETNILKQHFKVGQCFNYLGTGMMISRINIIGEYERTSEKNGQFLISDNTKGYIQCEYLNSAGEAKTKQFYIDDLEFLLGL